jgi:hypothetical protein
MPLITSLRVSVRVGEIDEHEESVRRLAAKASADANTRNWVAYQIVAGDAGSYIYTSTVESWADLVSRETTPDMVRRLFGERTGNSLLAQMNRGVDSLQALTFRAREDLSCPPEESPEEPAPFLQRLRVRARSGGQEACDELIRKAVEAVRKTDDERRFLTLQPLVGDMMEYSIAQRLRDPAQLDRIPSVPELLISAFGASEGPAILRAGREGIERMQADLSIHRPDLSNAA